MLHGKHRDIMQCLENAVWRRRKNPGYSLYAMRGWCCIGKKRVINYVRLGRGCMEKKRVIIYVRLGRGCMGKKAGNNLCKSGLRRYGENGRVGVISCLWRQTNHQWDGAVRAQLCTLCTHRRWLFQCRLCQVMLTTIRASVTVMTSARRGL